MKTITGNIDIEKIKRCYIPGAVIEIECPNCKKILKKDMADDYLSHPVIGESDTLCFYCPTCGDGNVDYCEFVMPVKVLSAIVTLEYDPDKITPE